MSKPQITIKDIARELGVSPSTVSRALKDNPDISQETRDAIHKYAREHNYKPNVLALNLRTSRSNTIGVIIPQITRMQIGPNTRRLIPCAFFVGAVFLMIVDVVCRTLLVAEIPVGIVTSLIGAPIFLLILKRAKEGWL